MNENQSVDSARMISDLNFFDKLSLKGKLFELQKKLNIIEIEKKMEDQTPFQPQIVSHYQLVNREPSVLESIDRAELIRKVNRH